MILRSTLQGLLYSTLNPSGDGLDCRTRVYINHSKGGLRRRARGSRARYCISATTCHFPFRLGRPIHCSCSGSSILIGRLSTKCSFFRGKKSACTFFSPDRRDCRSRKMLQNASLLAIVAVDTEENEPIKNEVWWVRRHFLGPRRGASGGACARRSDGGRLKTEFD